MQQKIRESDRLLTKRIQERMRWDMRISPADIRIEVRAGIVSLNGAVDSAFRRRAALEIVGYTEGILGFEDHLTVVAGYSRKDSELESIIREQLASLKLLPGEHVAVTAVDGIVKLTGIVYRARSKAHTAGMVWALSGVKDCIDLIEVAESAESAPTTNIF